MYYVIVVVWLHVKPVFRARKLHAMRTYLWGTRLKISCILFLQLEYMRVTCECNIIKPKRLRLVDEQIVYESQRSLYIMFCLHFVMFHLIAVSLFCFWFFYFGWNSSVGDQVFGNFCFSFVFFCCCWKN